MTMFTVIAYRPNGDDGAYYRDDRDYSDSELQILFDKDYLSLAERVAKLVHDDKNNMNTYDSYETTFLIDGYDPENHDYTDQEICEDLYSKHQELYNSYTNEYRNFLDVFGKEQKRKAEKERIRKENLKYAAEINAKRRQEQQELVQLAYLEKKYRKN